MQVRTSSGRWRILVVDDEPLARDGLRLLLGEDADVGEVLEAKGGREAVSLIRNGRPDLVFLDVQMPELDGFDVVREVGAAHMPAVVFVTAHDRYATRAFDVNAIDYLLKPVMRDRFAHALQRIRLRLQSPNEAQRRMIALLETLADRPQYPDRLAIRSGGKTSFVNLEDVHWIRAAENYVQLHVASGHHLLHVPIGTLEASLDPAMFLRVHRSMIVNVRQIRELQPAFHGEYVILLRSGVRLQSSRSYHAKIGEWAANPF